VVLVAVARKLGGAPNGGGGCTVTSADLESEQPKELVTVTKSVSVPAPPAVNVMLRVPLPEVMVPPVMLQEKVAPAHSWMTEAMALAPENMGEATSMVTFGFGLT